MTRKIIATLALLLLIGGSAAVAQPPANKVLFMGTSTTEGAGANPVTSRYVDLVKAARPNNTYTLLARHGTTLVNADPAKSWEHTVIPSGHDIVIMQFGTVEWIYNVPATAFQGHATAFLARVRAANPNARLIWLSPWIPQYTVPVPQFSAQMMTFDARANLWQELGMAIETALRTVQGEHIDLDPTGSRRLAVPYSTGEVGGLHHNNAGHRKIADAVLARI